MGLLVKHRERFADFTFVDAYVRRIGNFNLFEEIIDAKEQAKKHKSRLSTSFWSNLRMKWVKINSAESLLVVANQAEEVPRNLLLALQTCTSTNTRTRSSVPLVSWLSSCAAVPPQKAIVGLFRHSLSKHPSSGGHLNIAIAIMKMVARLRVPGKFPHECGVMFCHWDVTCCSWLSSVCKSGLREDVFLDQNLEVCSLVINAAHVKKIAQAVNEAEVAEELKSVCTSSTLGARIYGPVLSKLAITSYIGEVIEICELVLFAEVNQTTLNDAFAKAEASATRWEFDLRCRAKSTIEGNFMELIVTLMVVDSVSVARALIFLWVKEKGLRTKQIVPLWFEKTCSNLIMQRCCRCP